MGEDIGDEFDIIEDDINGDRSALLAFYNETPSSPIRNVTITDKMK